MESNNARNESNVLRPSFKQWLPGLIAIIRRTDNSPPVSDQKSDNTNVHFFPVPAAVINHSVRIAELELQNAVLIGDCAEWNDRCQSLESNLNRAREQVVLASHRLASVGESIPDSDTTPRSALQESYKNFAMAVTLKEGKLEKARQRMASLQQKRACIVAEMLALAPAPSLAVESISKVDPCMPEDTISEFRDAA